MNRDNRDNVTYIKRPLFRNPDREADLQNKAARADRFERFWEQEGFEEVTNAWERTLMAELVVAPPGNDTERLKQAIIMGRKFKGWIMAVVRDGEIARRELEEIKSGRRPFF